MLTGSAAGMFYGLNRATADLDIVIDVNSATLPVLIGAFEPDYLADAEMARDAVQRHWMFNFIAGSGGLKIDFIVLADDPLDLEAMDRRRTLDWHGTSIQVIDPTDLVLNKLRWARESRSERQLEDIRAIMAAGDVVEDERFYGWIRRLGVGSLLDPCTTAGHDS